VQGVEDSEIKAYVKRRYGEIAQGAGSCGCGCGCECGPSATDAASQLGYSAEDLASVPDASSMGLGCGNPVALASLREGDIVLDLGSGGGIDVFLAANRVGPNGRVIGVDMTDAMIAKAAATAEQHGYANVEFRLGEIEQLPVDDDSVDVVLSNCVINLSPDKARVFTEAYRVLKPNGRILISDIVTEGRLPERVRSSLAAWAGCVAGALEKQQYLDAIRDAGFNAVRIVSESTCGLEYAPEWNGTITSVQVEAYKPS
jgi:ubiquinone/menaquinone biosynthesis C-methylase UbiE